MNPREACINSKIRLEIDQSKPYYPDLVLKLEEYYDFLQSNVSLEMSEHTLGEIQGSLQLLDLQGDVRTKDFILTGIM